MKSDFDLSGLPSLLERQLSGFFPVSEDEISLIKKAMPAVLGRVEHCLANVDNKYFRRDGEAFFSPFHSGQWLIFLCYMTNTLSSDSNMDLRLRKTIADKVYYLNKIMHSVDIYHEVELPSVFFMEHPVGTVLGRARYSDGFMAYQGCTVGGNKGHYPTLGRNFRMMSGSKILGQPRGRQRNACRKHLRQGYRHPVRRDCLRFFAPPDSQVPVKNKRLFKNAC